MAAHFTPTQAHLTALAQLAEGIKDGSAYYMCVMLTLMQDGDEADPANRPMQDIKRWVRLALGPHLSLGELMFQEGAPVEAPVGYRIRALNRSAAARERRLRWIAAMQAQVQQALADGTTIPFTMEIPE